MIYLKILGEITIDVLIMSAMVLGALLFAVVCVLPIAMSLEYSNPLYILIYIPEAVIAWFIVWLWLSPHKK